MTQQTMTVEKIEAESGYAEIKVNTVEIADKFEIILHRIYPNEILNLVYSLESTLNLLDLDNHKDFVHNRIIRVENKIKTLLPNRKKRGIANTVGNILNWMYGTMDNNDRLNIESHLNLIDQNNHNLIENSNQQITINENLNKSIILIKNIIEKDRTKILDRFNKLNYTEMKILSESAFLEFMFKLDYIEKQVEHIQDNIASARIGLLHPNILTDEEINQYNIDVKTLYNIRLAAAKHVDNSIIFAIKIPIHTLTTNKNLLIPIPNSQGNEVVSNMEYIIRNNGQILTYSEGKILSELTKTTNCINHKNCKLVKKKEEEILFIEDSIIIVKNIKQGRLKSTCDNRIFTLNGNYLINFNNCTIRIKNKEFSNKLRIFTEKFIIPITQNVTFNNTDEITFDDIVLNKINNIKEIREIKYYRIVNYSLSSLSITVIIILAIYIYCKSKQKKINIESRIQENPKTKEGGVTYHSNSNDDTNNIGYIMQKYA